MPSVTSVTLNISLPEPLKRYVDSKASSGTYGSASEFVREAIRDKLARDSGDDKLRLELLKGLNSGKPIPFKRGHFAQKKRALARRYQK